MQYLKEISSLQNYLIKEALSLHQKKYRIETGLFLLEGLKCVQEAANFEIKSPEIKNIFIEKSSYSLDKEIFKQFIKKFPDKIYLCDKKVMKKISSAESPPEIIAVAKQVRFSLEDFFHSKNNSNPFIIVLENIKDAGNLGTIIRTAKAANACGIMLAGECADLYNPKVVRSTVGNLWKLPIVFCREIKNIRTDIETASKTKFGQMKFKFFAAAVSGNSRNLYDEIDFKLPCAVFFGSEADGLSSELISQADEILKIPMHREIESLNVAVSVSVIAYEVYRDRYTAPKSNLD